MPNDDILNPLDSNIPNLRLDRGRRTELAPAAKGLSPNAPELAMPKTDVKHVVSNHIDHTPLAIHNLRQLFWGCECPGDYAKPVWLEYCDDCAMYYDEGDYLPPMAIVESMGEDNLWADKIIGEIGQVIELIFLILITYIRGNSGCSEWEKAKILGEVFETLPPNIRANFLSSCKAIVFLKDHIINGNGMEFGEIANRISLWAKNDTLPIMRTYEENRLNKISWYGGGKRRAVRITRGILYLRDTSHLEMVLTIIFRGYPVFGNCIQALFDGSGAKFAKLAAFLIRNRTRKAIAYHGQTIRLD